MYKLIEFEVEFSLDEGRRVRATTLTYEGEELDVTSLFSQRELGRFADELTELRLEANDDRAFESYRDQKRLEETNNE